MPTCQNCHKQINIASEDLEFYNKIQVPPPTWCPVCRMKRRLVWHNEHNIYQRKCEATGKTVFSIYSAKSPFKKVYDRDYWWSDKWDATSYGRDYDFSRPFFSQLKELLYDVPHFSASVLDMENSEYCANAGNLKNCYLVFNASACEDCYYSLRMGNSKDCYDCTNIGDSQLCYQCVCCAECYMAFYCVDCGNSQDIYFSRGLKGCSSCFGCVNLNNKQFHIFNQPYSETDYKKKIKELWDGSRQSTQVMLKKRDEIFYKNPVKFAHQVNNQDCTGEYVLDSKNVKQSYFVIGENMKFCQDVMMPPAAQDCYDYSVWGEGASLLYECYECGVDVYGLKFCWDVWPKSSNIEYSISCHSSSDLFGCVGLTKKQYCVFNKQYTKDAYEALVAKIKKQMDEMPYTDTKGRVYKYGEFFPPELSPFGYNETWLQDFYPLSKEQALKESYRWFDIERQGRAVDIKGNDMPARAGDAADDITKKVISCSHDGKCAENCMLAFRILPQELAFYRKHNLPLPTMCFNCRNAERIKYKNTPDLYPRSCLCAGATSSKGIYTNSASHFHGASKCPNTFESPYSKDRPEMVYCEQCFREEVN